MGGDNEGDAGTVNRDETERERESKGKVWLQGTFELSKWAAADLSQA